MVVFLGFLPGHKNTDNFDTYFETNHHLTAEHLCKMYGLEYETASRCHGTSRQIKHLFTQNDKQPKLLEVFTPTAN